MTRLMREIFWLLLVFLFATLFNLLLFGPRFIKGHFEIGDEHMVFAVPSIIALCSSLGSAFFIVLATRVLAAQIKWKFVFPILLLLGLFCLASVELLFPYFSIFTAPGWTIFPPLSALKERDRSFALNMELATYFLRTLEMVVVVLMFWVTYRWGLYHGKKN